LSGARGPRSAGRPRNPRGRSSLGTADLQVCSPKGSRRGRLRSQARRRTTDPVVAATREADAPEGPQTSRSALRKAADADVCGPRQDDERRIRPLHVLARFVGGFVPRPRESSRGAEIPVARNSTSLRHRRYG
jgi:hypothetical protein